jgi:hypothetical protein
MCQPLLETGITTCSGKFNFLETFSGDLPELENLVPRTLRVSRVRRTATSVSLWLNQTYTHLPLLTTTRSGKLQSLHNLFGMEQQFLSRLHVAQDKASDTRQNFGANTYSVAQRSLLH